jgi:hypothetical protein
MTQCMPQYVNSWRDGVDTRAFLFINTVAEGRVLLLDTSIHDAYADRLCL